jgi:hypothetical protein
MPQDDYKPFLNFLTTHDCGVDFREFRGAKQEEPLRRSPRLPLLSPRRNARVPNVEP